MIVFCCCCHIINDLPRHQQQEINEHSSPAHCSAASSSLTVFNHSCPGNLEPHCIQWALLSDRRGLTVDRRVMARPTVILPPHQCASGGFFHLWQAQLPPSSIHSRPVMEQHLINSPTMENHQMNSYAHRHRTLTTIIIAIGRSKSVIWSDFLQ